MPIKLCSHADDCLQFILEVPCCSATCLIWVMCVHRASMLHYQVDRIGCVTCRTHLRLLKICFCIVVMHRMTCCMGQTVQGPSGSVTSVYAMGIFLDCTQFIAMCRVGPCHISCHVCREHRSQPPHELLLLPGLTYSPACQGAPLLSQTTRLHPRQACACILHSCHICICNEDGHCDLNLP